MNGREAARSGEWAQHFSNASCLYFAPSLSAIGKSPSLLVRLSPSSVNVYASSPVFIAIVFFIEGARW